MDKKLKGFYEYHSCLMEPWDGPAAIAFTDGVRIGAVLDRNGLRPARYIVTKSDLCVMASEVGVLDIQPQDIHICGRLEPGKIFFIDTQAGRIIKDEEIKDSISKQRPYNLWLKKNMIELDGLPAHSVQRPAYRKNYPLSAIRYPLEDTLIHLKAFGYTREDLFLNPWRKMRRNR